MAEDYAAKAKIVAEMDRIVLTDVKIEKQTLVDALDEIRKKGAGNAWATISFVIRKPRVNAVTPVPAGDPFAEGDGAGAWNEVKHPEIKERTTLNAEKISFAAAIDEICKQTGHRWWIELSEAGMPSLLIAPDEGGDESGK